VTDHLSPNAALLVVDLQPLTLGNARTISADDLVPRIAALVDAFRASGRPVVFALSTGTPAGATQFGAGGRVWPAELATTLPALAPRADELVVSRPGWSAFSGTELDAHLTSLGVEQLVIAGIATTFGVESSARDAYDRGYHVVIAQDAVSDPDPEGHARSIERVFPMLGTLEPTAALIALAE
jgi:nicotinamidase-related amidase